MTEIVFLSSHDYETPATTNYGDCILINTGSELIIMIAALKSMLIRLFLIWINMVIKVQSLFSHIMDNDHFKGIPKLLEQNRVSSIHTRLLLKYKEELLKRIGDGRKQPVQLPNKYSILMIILQLSPVRLWKTSIKVLVFSVQKVKL